MMNMHYMMNCCWMAGKVEWQMMNVWTEKMLCLWSDNVFSWISQTFFAIPAVSDTDCLAVCNVFFCVWTAICTFALGETKGHLALHKLHRINYCRLQLMDCTDSLHPVIAGWKMTKFTLQFADESVHAVCRPLCMVPTACILLQSFCKCSTPNPRNLGQM